MSLTPIVPDTQTVFVARRQIVKIWQQTRHARYGAAAYEDDEYDEADGEEEYVDDGDDWADGPLGMDPGASWKPVGHDSLRGGEKTNQKVGPMEEAPPAPAVRIRTIFDEDPNEGTDVKAATIDLDPIRRFVQVRVPMNDPTPRIASTFACRHLQCLTTAMKHLPHPLC